MAELWEVIGGTDSGGIIVRKGVAIKSEAETQRLSTGALIEGLELQNERLRFKKLSGGGPETGWVTVRLKGKDLVVRTTKKPPFNPYRILGVDPDATDAAIKSAYRKASLAVHPDRNPDDAGAAEKFRELTSAKEFLLDPFKRRLYNYRHGLLKPTAGQVWWSDWDTIFDELAVDDLAVSSAAAAAAAAAAAEPAAEPAAAAAEPAADPGASAEDVEEEGGGIPRGPGRPGAAKVDILVVGATGITGTLACMLLQRGLWPGRTWSIAGRDERKLKLLTEKFGGGPDFRGSSRIEAPEDLRRLAAGARVVVDLTGPSREIGAGVAEACADTGAHLVDNTGEADFSKKVRDELGARAAANGSCLVLHSGYCSVPVDFGVWRMVRHLRETYKVPTRRIDAYDATSGMVLSGTNYVSGGIWGGENTNGLDPFLLGGTRKCGVRPEDEERDSPYEDPITGGHSLLAAVSDRLVVRSSCELFDSLQPYGEKFHFSNWAVFMDRMSASNGIVMSHVAQKMYPSLLKQKKIPPRGSGPSERVRQECMVSRIFVAEADEPGPKPRKAYCIMNAGPGGFGDRYEGTAAMSLELACTLLDAEDAGRRSELRPGWGTPTFHTAHLGFYERLVARGARFHEIVDGAPSHELFQNILGQAMALEAS